MSTILKVTGLTKHFPVAKKSFFGTAETVQAVDDVSFEIGAGEAVGLVGESGCGKSTTGRLITRLIDPTSGSIEFDGEEISNKDSKQLLSIRPKLQMIFQDPYASLNPRHTVGTIVSTPMRINGIKPEGGT
ncbi:MAG: hypothetical protein RIR66_125, partial [Actinomycetota bacterium]